MSNVGRKTKATQLTLREAEPDDARMVFPWRNHPSTRQFINDPSPIPLDAHLAWWERALKDPNRHLLLAEHEGREVVVLRFDIDADIAVVSIYTDPAEAGRGFGYMSLREGQSWLHAKRPDVEQLQAEIDPWNRASISLFSKLGYRQVSERLFARPIMLDDQA